MTLAETKIVVFILSLLPAMIAGGYLLARRRYDIFEPYTFFCFPSLVFLVVSGIYTLYSGGLIGTQYFPSGSKNFLQVYMLAGVVHCICVAAFTAGYAMPRKGWRRVQNKLRSYQYWNRQRLIAFSSFFCIIGILATVHFITLLDIQFISLTDLSSKRFLSVSGGEYGSAALGYHRWGAMLLRIVFIFAACFILTRHRQIKTRHRWLLAGMFLAGSFFPFLVSSRGALLYFVIMFLVIWHYTHGPIKIRKLIYYALICLFLLMIMTGLREGINNPQRIASKLNPYDFMETIGSRPNQGYANLANIMLAVPKNWDYQMGRTMVSWLVAPIPRQYWPQKPLINIGEYIKIRVYGRAKTAGGAIPTNSIGEFYINFGAVGIPLVIMWWFLGGIATRRMYLTLRPLLSTNPTALILYVIILFSLLPALFTNSLSATAIGFAKSGVPVVAGIVFISSRYYYKKVA